MGFSYPTRSPTRHHAFHFLLRLRWSSVPIPLLDFLNFGESSFKGRTGYASDVFSHAYVPYFHDVLLYIHARHVLLPCTTLRKVWNSMNKHSVWKVTSRETHKRGWRQAASSRFSYRYPTQRKSTSFALSRSRHFYAV
jgi:hypothetical protein